MGREPFYDEASLPFRLEGGGTVFRLVPERGFRRESLAGSEDERLVIVDCPDAEGWLVSADVVAEWMARTVRHPVLEELLASHPLYAYLTQPDEEGLSRGGRVPLVQWSPGFPTLASLEPPEFLPDDDEAPRVNRDRSAYTDAVEDLLARIEREIRPLEVEVGIRFSVSGTL